MVTYVFTNPEHALQAQKKLVDYLAFHAKSSNTNGSPDKKFEAKDAKQKEVATVLCNVEGKTISVEYKNNSPERPIVEAMVKKIIGEYDGVAIQHQLEL